ncbi:MAG: FKBP-type peptidyl-prolyl cis-trans isomerase [Saprospiraceae bacterium]|nr:FKBP-type peptidyl-prolyl cis-trans isomerase [Saprospiraceae bacterium]
MKYILIGMFAMLFAVSCSKKAKKTATGMKYEFLLDAEGALAQPGDWVIIDTRITTTPDTIIYDSRQDQPNGVPIQLPVDPENTRRGNLSPLHDVLVLASVGDSIRLYYPVDSFATPPPTVANYDVVNYDIKVRQISSQTEFDQMRQQQQQAAASTTDVDAMRQRAGQLAEGLRALRAQYQSGQLEPQITRTASGLGYIMTTPGQPNTNPAPGATVRTHYVGMLVENGAVFDNSLTRGATYDFQLGQNAVIAGWEEALPLMNKGATAILFVPAQLAYGATGFGNIPANAELMFYLQYVQ